MCLSVKVKCNLVQALRLCTGRTAQRGSRGITLLFLDHGTRRGWGVSVTPRQLFTLGKEPVPIVQEAGWAPGPVWTGAENHASPPGFDPRIVQTVASRYTDWATGPTAWMWPSAKITCTHTERGRKRSKLRKEGRKKERNVSLSSKKWLVKILSCHVSRSVISANKICRYVK